MRLQRNQAKVAAPSAGASARPSGCPDHRAQLRQVPVHGQHIGVHHVREQCVRQPVALDVDAGTKADLLLVGVEFEVAGYGLQVRTVDEFEYGLVPPEGIGAVNSELYTTAARASSMNSRHLNRPCCPS